MAMSARERNLLILLGVIAVAALAWFLLFGGGGDEADNGAAPTPVTPPSPPPAAEPLPPDPGRRPPRTFAFFGGRDPFVPLVVAEEGAGGTGTAAAPTEPTDGETPTDGFEPTDGDQDGDGDGDGGGGGPVAMGGREVVLIDVFTRGGEQVVQVSVDGDTFVVGEGERFAGNFEVTSIEGTCATFLFGDESFTLCEGERPK
jgi:hypothetical protein